MKTIIIVWFVAGLALLIWSANELWQIGNNEYLGINSGAFKATLLGLCFSALCIIGASGLKIKKTWGRLIILSVACLSLFYSAAYLLMGGFEDTGPIYAIAVLGVFLLSISSIVILRKKRFTAWQLNNAIETDRE